MPKAPKKTTIELEVKEFELPDTGDIVDFFKVGETVYLHSSDDSFTVSLETLIETLDELYLRANNSTFEDKIIFLLSGFFEQIKGELE